MSEQDWLGDFFRPRSVVMIGASERSAWSGMVFRRFAAYGYAGRVYGVNPGGAPAHGLPIFRSCRELPEPVDLAFVMVRADLVAETLTDAAAAGIRNAVVLSSGFAEAGEAGAALQRELVAKCRELGVRMLGPNSLGFANLSERLVATSIPARQPLCVGSVGVVSQSGSIAADIGRFCHQQHIGLSFLCTPGNAAMVDTLDAIDYMIGDPATRVILAYAESAFSAERFRGLAARALAAGKPILLYKTGRGELSAAVARAHTGSLVGDDRVFDAVCRQYGVIRVNSVEELVTTGGLIGAAGPLAPGKGVAFLSVSGGAAAMFADLAEENGVPMPPFARETAAALTAVVPAYATVSNPFDVTGGALTDATIWERALPLVLGDPAIGLALTLMGVPASEDETIAQRAGYAAIARGYRAAGREAIIVGQVVQPLTPFTQGFLAETGCAHAFCGLEPVAKAAGHLARWSAALHRGAPVVRALPAADAARPQDEYAVLEWLGARGVPVVPIRLATSAADAAAIAGAIGGPVALKIASPAIAHKTEVGGVRLNVAPGEAGDAFAALCGAVARHAPGVPIDGVLVAPMRAGGVELFVGVARDPDWGPVLALGLGGVWIELLNDTAMRPLPVSPGDVHAMLGELRGAALLRGYRGSAPVDLDRLADVIVAIGDAALALGADLAALEINPLFASAERIEALDALASYAPASPAR
ncbi:MAG: acetate--CoA ligase family protein [Sphingomonadales bacterium]|nr:acetate--CoA ligase family protein [Sphingomonadales bacterium]